MYFSGTKCCSLIFCSLLSLSLFAKDAKPTDAQGLRKPLCFVENKGQVMDQDNHPRNDIQYKLSTPGMCLYIGNGQIHYQFKKIEGAPASLHASGYNMNVTLLGADPNAKVIASDKQEYFENYYLSQYSGNGFTAHSYDKVIYKDVYPGIDWVLYVKDNKVEYDFIVRPGGDINNIQIAYTGATALGITKDGGIVAETPMGRIEEKTPYSYETSSGKTVASRFVLKNNVISFETARYAGALTIDPYLLWSTYFGGAGEDVATAVKANGNVTYAGGYTLSAGLSSGAGVFQTALAGTGVYNAFVAKYTNTGTLTWATYFGGTATTVGTSLAIDNTGAVYLGGSTASAGTGLTGGPGAIWQLANNGGTDGFLIKLAANNGSSTWCTFYGGPGTDVVNGVACDGADNVYITGQTSSATDITTGTPYQATLNGTSNAFIAKFSAAGAIQWSTYYGGTGQDEGLAIACDAANNVIITGQTSSSTNISSTGNTLNGTNDAFVASFNSAGTSRNWGSYFGGAGTEQGNAVVCDASNNIIITGSTTSTSGIATTNAYQTIYGGGIQDAFIAKFYNTGMVLWSTYYGGPDVDNGQGICLDAFGNIVIAGGTLSTTGISTTGSYQSAIAGSDDAFISKLTPTGQLIWGTYFGGSQYDFANAVTCDLTDNEIAIAGNTASTSGIASAGTAQTANGGGAYDGFVTKFYNDTLVTINQPYTDTLLCPAGSFTVYYTTNYNFQAGNIFNVELSNAAGVFPVGTTNIIGTVTSSTSGSISCVIPAGTIIGTSYRIQIVSTNPVTTFNDGYNIDVVSVIPPSTASGPSPVCVGGSVSLFDAASYPVTSYSWAGPNGFVSGAHNPVIAGPITTAAAGTYSVTTTQIGCPSSTTTVTIAVNTNIPPTPATSVNGHCFGSSIQMFATPDTTAGSIIYNWAGPLSFTSDLQNPVLTSATFPEAGYYYVTDTIGGCGSDSGFIYVDVQTTTPVAIAITVSPYDTVCQGTNVTFTATTSTGGSSPTYQWMNGTAPVVGAVYSTWSTPTLVNADAIYCVLNSSLNCPSPVPANSNMITMNIVNSAPLAYIIASAGPAVTPGIPVTFTSSIYEGGVSPIYQWVLNGVNIPGANSATYTLPSVTAYDVVSLTVTSTMDCASPDFGQSNSVILYPPGTNVTTVAAAFGDLELFPNPNKGSFTLKGEVQNTNTVSIEILNTLGQVVYNENAAVSNAGMNKTIDLNNIPDGIYLLHIFRDGASKTIRFSVQH